MVPPDHASRLAAAPARERNRPATVLPVVLFVAMFSWSMVQVGLPFYVQQITGDRPAVTLQWIGIILAITPLLTVVTTPVWMSIGRARPLRSYVLTQGLQGFGFLLMAASHETDRLLGCRIFLGLSGPTTAFAFLLAAQSEPSRAMREASRMQSALMLGAITGPLATGAVITSLGHVGSFLVGGALLWGCAALVAWTGHRAVSHPAVPASRPAIASRTNVAALCLISLILYTQMFFLEPILPVFLPALGVTPGRELYTASWIVFGSGLMLAVGAWSTTTLAKRFGEARTLYGCVTSSSLCLGFLAFPSTVLSFSLLRFAEALFLGPVLSLVLTRVLRSHDEQAVGFVNSARFGANFVGPVLATALLSWAPPATLFGVLAVAGMLCIPIAIPIGRRRADSTGGR